MSEDHGLPGDVVAAIHARRKIEAIKLLRGHRKLGLKEAKQIVDAYEAGNPAGTSQPGLREEGTGGRLLLLIVLMAAAWGAYHYLS